MKITLELQSYLASLSHFVRSTGGNGKMLVEGFPFICKCLTTLMREESCLRLFETVEVTRYLLRLGCKPAASRDD